MSTPISTLAEARHRRRVKGFALRTHPKRLRCLEEQIEAINLRKQGLSFHEIAVRQGCSDNGARKRVLDGIKHVTSEAVEELREIQGARLDAMLMALWPKAEAGDVDSIHAVIRLEELRAKLFGTNAKDMNEAELRRAQLPIELFRVMQESAVQAARKLQAARALPPPDSIEADFREEDDDTETEPDA